MFEFIFGSVEDVTAYVSHPAHLEVAKEFSPYFEKCIVIAYKPTTMELP